MRRRGRETRAPIERVADDGTPAEGGYGGPEGDGVCREVGVEVGEGYAGFDEGVGVGGGDVDDGGEAVEVEG